MYVLYSTICSLSILFLKKIFNILQIFDTLRNKIVQNVLFLFTYRTICYIIFYINCKICERMIFLNRLKQLRLERGLLQSDIAKVIKKSERIVGFYETGERDMNTETLSTLADFFNVSIDYLLGKNDIRNIEDEFKTIYSKEIEGLTEEEIKEALEFYKMIKNRRKKEK